MQVIIKPVGFECTLWDCYLFECKEQKVINIVHLTMQLFEVDYCYGQLL